MLTKIKIDTNTLKAKRVVKGLSQKELANKLDLSSITYGAKERGESEFSATEIVTLSLVLQLTLAEVNLIFFENRITEMLNV